VLDLAVTPNPTLDHEGLAALFTPAEQRSQAQHDRLELDNALIAQLQISKMID